MGDRILQANDAGPKLSQRPCGRSIEAVDRFHIAPDLQIEPRPSTFHRIKFFYFSLSLRTFLEHRSRWFVCHSVTTTHVDAHE